MKKILSEIYCISNSVNEWNSDIVGYFPTEKSAKDHLKYAQDWYCRKGTGTIYKITTYIVNINGEDCLKTEKTRIYST